MKMVELIFACLVSGLRFGLSVCVCVRARVCELFAKILSPNIYQYIHISSALWEGFH